MTKQEKARKEAREQAAVIKAGRPWWYWQVLDFCRRSNAAKWYRC